MKKKRKADKNSAQEPERRKKRKSEDLPQFNAVSDHEPVEEAKKNEACANKKQKKKKKEKSCVYKLRC